MTTGEHGDDLSSSGVFVLASDNMLGADQRKFRGVMGCCPTGVAVITAQHGGDLHGMVVGTLTSVSLDPPLVGFFPGKSSQTWPRIEKAGRFCANVLAAEQLNVCKIFASQIEGKYDSVVHTASPGGMPIIDGIAAWVDCRIDSVQEIGDHYLVVGAVEAMGQGSGSPLIFVHGGFCAPRSLEIMDCPTP